MPASSEFKQKCRAHIAKNSTIIEKLEFPDSRRQGDDMSSLKKQPEIHLEEI
jgi:hypothetical protein